MDRIRYARMESSGRWYQEALIANLLLGRRMAKAKGYSKASMDARIQAILGMNLDADKLPSDGTIRLWARSLPDLPEMFLTDGVVTIDQILPELRPYLKSQNGVAEMRQDYVPVRSGEAEDSGSTNGVILLGLVALGIWLWNK